VTLIARVSCRLRESGARIRLDTSQTALSAYFSASSTVCCKFTSNRSHLNTQNIHKHALSVTSSTRNMQGDHFPDHMKFPDFSLTLPVQASKDYPVSSVYRYGQQSLFHSNEKEAQLPQTNSASAAHMDGG